jgi:hypothetical protein
MLLVVERGAKLCREGKCEPGRVDERERIWELLERGQAHEQEHDLGPARRLLTEALDAASAADMPEVVRISRTLLGIVAHKADRLDEARAHLDAALTLALDAGASTDEAYCHQELGFSCSTREIRSWPWASSMPCSPSPRVPGSSIWRAMG